MNMYVSNLGFQVRDEELKSLFTEYGEVHSARVILDRESGRSKGFAFVEMPEEAGELAMKELDGRFVDGRTMSVSVAKPKSNAGTGSFSGKSRW
jgi:RNA recognition motif-containing protein